MDFISRRNAPDAEREKELVKFNKLKRYCVIAIATSISVLSLQLPTHPAERIKFNYSLLGFNLKVEDLALYATEGKVTRQLDFYLKRFSDEQQQQLKEFLQLKYEIDPVLVYRFSRTSVGKRMLYRVGEILQTPPNLNGFYGLRAAVVQTAGSPEGVNFVNFLKHFPTDLQLNLAEILKLLKEISTNHQETAEFITSLKQQEAKDSSQLNIAKIPDLSAPGQFSVVKQPLKLYDTQRDRNLNVDLYLPQTQNAPKSVPVIVISNGLGARRNNFQELAEHLTSYGFAVATLDHPGSDRDRQKAFIRGLYKENFDAADFIDRPLDISYILDELTKLNQNQFQNRLNLQQVGVFGYSFGGATAVSLTGANLNFDKLQHDCSQPLDLINISILYQCRALELPRQPRSLEDKRIKATYLFVPFGSSLFGAEQLGHVSTPTMWQTVDRDFLTSLLKEQLPAFKAVGSQDKYLVVSEKLPHTTATLDQKRSQTQNKQSKISKTYQKALALAFFQTYIAQNSEYRPYLTSDYLQVLSQEPYNLHLLK
jgi:predicted dienelactone hydrolase